MFHDTTNVKNMHLSKCLEDKKFALTFTPKIRPFIDGHRQNRAMRKSFFANVTVKVRTEMTLATQKFVLSPRKYKNCLILYKKKKKNSLKCI